MNPKTRFSFLIFTTLSLTLLLHPSFTNASTSLIEDVCARSKDKNNCVASLGTNPDSAKANPVQLGIIALNLASSNATDTSSYIQKSLRANTTLDPAIEQALSDCSDEYLDAVQQLDDSLSPLLANAYDDVRTFVQAAIADSQSCDNAFKANPGTETLLSKRNANFRQLSNNVLAIIEHLEQK